MRRLYSALLAAHFVTAVARADGPTAPPAAKPAPASTAASQLPAPPAGSADCLTGALSGCDPCTDGAQVWGRVEALMGWGQGARTPPLVTDGGAPQTVLFGGSRLNGDLRGGLRTEFGAWLCDDRFAVQLGYFFLSPDQSFGRFGSPTADRAIGRPFINADTGLPAFEQVVVPGALAGFVTVSSSTSGVMGADALLRAPICCQPTCDGSYRLDLLGGYRYFGLNDQLTIRENLAPLAAPFVPGTRITVLDSFRTENTFHGASLGAAFVGRRGAYNVELTGRLDLGSMTREVTVFGATRNDVPGLAPVTRAGGLLAQTSNIGTYRSSSFTLIPEFDLRLGCRVTERVSVSAGYWFLLLTDVARAGDQIDLAVNPNLLPGAPPGAGPARPAPVLRQTNAWVQGISLGVSVKW